MKKIILIVLLVLTCGIMISANAYAEKCIVTQMEASTVKVDAQWGSLGAAIYNALHGECIEGTEALIEFEASMVFIEKQLVIDNSLDTSLLTMPLRINGKIGEKKVIISPNESLGDSGAIYIKSINQKIKIENIKFSGFKGEAIVASGTSQIDIVQNEFIDCGLEDGQYAIKVDKSCTAVVNIISSGFRAPRFVIAETSTAQVYMQNNSFFQTEIKVAQYAIDIDSDVFEFQNNVIKHMERGMINYKKALPTKTFIDGIGVKEIPYDKKIITLPSLFNTGPKITSVEKYKKNDVFMYSIKFDFANTEFDDVRFLEYKPIPDKDLSAVKKVKYEKLFDACFLANKENPLEYVECDQISDPQEKTITVEEDFYNKNLKDKYIAILGYEPNGSCLEVEGEAEDAKCPIYATYYLPVLFKFPDALEEGDIKAFSAYSSSTNYTPKDVYEIMMTNLSTDKLLLSRFEADSNKDGIPDSKDKDGDGIEDSEDNCPNVANPDQKNSDSPGDPTKDDGNACDDDDDDDGILDDGNKDSVVIDIKYHCGAKLGEDTIAQWKIWYGEDYVKKCIEDKACFNENFVLHENCDDNCRTAANPDQADMDFDGMGDACDNDKDGDGYSGYEETKKFAKIVYGVDIKETKEELDKIIDPSKPFDNCPDVYNPNQLDVNKDGIGDACDNNMYVIKDAEGKDVGSMDMTKVQEQSGMIKKQQDKKATAAMLAISFIKKKTSEQIEKATKIFENILDTKEKCEKVEGMQWSEEYTYCHEVCAEGYKWKKVPDPEDKDGDDIFACVDSNGCPTGYAHNAETKDCEPIDDPVINPSVDACPSVWQTRNSGTNECETIASLTDIDLDGIPDVYDNCPTVGNPPAVGEPGQADSDGDGIGDACKDLTMANLDVNLGGGGDGGCALVAGSAVPNLGSLLMLLPFIGFLARRKFEKK